MSATVTPDMKGIVERAVAYPEPQQVPTHSEDYKNNDTWASVVPATFVLRAPYGDSGTVWPIQPSSTARPPSCEVRKKARAERKRLKKDKQRHKKGR